MIKPEPIDLETLRAKRREAAERQIITLKDDTLRPPPTICTSAWQGTIFGPFFGQLSKDISPEKSLTQKILFVIICIAFVICLLGTILHGLWA